MLDEYDENESFKKWYAYGNYIDEVLMSGTSVSPVSIRVYVQDHLYSTVALLNSTGTVLERYEYDVYGNPYIFNADYESRATSDFGNSRLFTGRRLDILDDGNLKIQYNRNRYLDHYTGRWLTEDPMAHVDGMNLYEYVRSNPLVYSDPFGLCKKGDIQLKLNDYEFYLSGIRLQAFGNGKVLLTVKLDKNGKVSIPGTKIPNINIHDLLQGKTDITWDELLGMLIDGKYTLIPHCITTKDSLHWRIRYDFEYDVDIRKCEVISYQRKWYTCWIWKHNKVWGWGKPKNKIITIKTDWLYTDNILNYFTIVSAGLIPESSIDKYKRQLQEIIEYDVHIKDAKLKFLSYVKKMGSELVDEF